MLAELWANDVNAVGEEHATVIAKDPLFCGGLKRSPVIASRFTDYVRDCWKKPTRGGVGRWRGIP